MSTFERPFFFASVKDVRTGVRFLKLLHERQFQINHLLHCDLRIEDEVIFYLQMLKRGTMEDLQEMLASCEECGYVKGLQTLPVGHGLVKAMLRYAESHARISNQVMEPGNEFVSVQRWFEKMAFNDRELLDTLCFITDEKEGEEV